MTVSTDRGALHTLAWNPTAVDTIAQGEAQIHPNSALDDVAGKMVSGIDRNRHAGRLRHDRYRGKASGCDKPLVDYFSSVFSTSLIAAFDRPNWRAIADGFTPALIAARTRLALVAVTPSLDPVFDLDLRGASASAD